jgi:hypothetical protein
LRRGPDADVEVYPAKVRILAQEEFLVGSFAKIEPLDYPNVDRQEPQSESNEVSFILNKLKK